MSLTISWDAEDQPYHPYIRHGVGPKISIGYACDICKMTVWYLPSMIFGEEDILKRHWLHLSERHPEVYKKGIELGKIPKVEE